MSETKTTMAIPRRKFGHSGPELTILGFGAMRLPGFRTGDFDTHMEGAVKLLRRGIELGINYIDTAQLYDAGHSEIAVGRAIREARDRVFISTKILPNLVSSADHFQSLFEESCERLQTRRIDIFYFHGLYWKQFRGQFAEMGLLKAAEKLRAGGRIGLLGFSSHDRPENIGRLIDTGAFDGMLVQYNLVDEVNAGVISRAGEKGMGVTLMGPVGGGRMAGTGPDFTRLVPPEFGDAPALALKFVWSNPDVTCALSGMESESVLEANVRSAKNYAPLTSAGRAEVAVLQKKLEKLREIYCSGCGYCLPCPEKVNIPGIFNLLICHQVLGAERYARDMYRLIGVLPIIPGSDASACIECGQCEDKCPQKIHIIDQLKRSHELLGK
ncbi:MAG: aldo/keto reductase [bacterium]|nr:aldo/keto reductase [bacterium]